MVLTRPADSVARRRVEAAGIGQRTHAGVIEQGRGQSLTANDDDDLHPKGVEQRRLQLLVAARGLGLDGLRIAVVSGDDVKNKPALDAAEVIESDASIAIERATIISANAYLGAAPLAAIG